MWKLLPLSIFALFASSLTPQIAHAEPLRNGGKLLLTNGITNVEGTSGGGLTPWATIAGTETKDGIGLSAHATVVDVKSYDYRSAGIAIGLFDRVELSIARQDFNTRDVGTVLGIGKSFRFQQNIVGAKLRLFGDLVYDNPLIPAVAIGTQYKHNEQGAIVRAFGARQNSGVDYYVTATKLLLSRSLLINTTFRLTKANQMGLLGFGGDQSNRRSLQLEGSIAYQFSRRLAIGGEYRAKPSKLSVAREDDWFDAFAAYAINRHLTATIAYTDLGSIATVDGQRGGLFSLQAAF